MTAGPTTLRLWLGVEFEANEATALSYTCISPKEYGFGIEVTSGRQLHSA